MSAFFKEAPPLSTVDQNLINRYVELGLPVDDLPYTPEFERLCADVYGSSDRETQQKALHRLLNLRKARRLPRVGRVEADRGLFSERPSLNQDEEQLIMNLVPRSAGTVGRRDALPFTDEFDLLVQAFNAHTRRNLSHHAVWRLVSRVAKRPQ